MLQSRICRFGRKVALVLRAKYQCVKLKCSVQLGIFCDSLQYSGQATFYTVSLLHNVKLMLNVPETSVTRNSKIFSGELHNFWEAILPSSKLDSAKNIIHFKHPAYVYILS